MLFSHETLIGLLASRHKLYVQLGLADKYVVAVRESPILNISAEDAATMSVLIGDLEGQIGDLNQRIARFRGPIADDSLAAADPAG